MPFLGDWEETTIGEFALLTYGKSLPVRKRNASGQVPVFGSNGIVGYHDTALTDGPTIIIGRKGTAGAVHYSPIPCWPIDTTFFFTADDADLTKFKYYVLRTLGLDAMNTDSAVPGINRNAVQARELYVPPLPEQRRIAHILGALDDKIELNRRMNTTLEQMARALFKSWFIDFDPVRAKMSGRWRRGKSLPGLPAHLYDLFPSRLVPSELGEAPEGWGVKSLDEIANFRNGLALQKFRPAENEVGLPVVKIAQLRSGNTNGGEWATNSITPECIIDDGDIIFSWSGSLMIKVWYGGRAALNQHLFKVTSSEYPKWFYLNCLKSHLAAFQEIAADKATTMGHIKRQHLNDAKCVIPSQTLLASVDATFAELITRQTSIGIESRNLSVLRDTMLPKLVSGELRITEAST